MFFKVFLPSQVALVVKNLPAMQVDIRDASLIPGSGRSPGGGHNNPLQCSCLENPGDGGASWAAVCGVAQSRTQLKRLSSSSSSDLNEKEVQKGLGFPASSVVKNLPANAGDMVGSSSGSGRSLGEGNGNLLQYSCLGNPMDRGA